MATIGITVLGVIFSVVTGDVRWVFLSLPFTVMLLVVGALAPTGYRLATDGVHVERRAGPRTIAYPTIRSVDRAPRPASGFTLLASKGAFGRFGRFWNPTLGFYRLYVTDSDRIVWLSTADGWIGLSPERPDEFVERLARRIAAR